MYLSESFTEPCDSDFSHCEGVKDELGLNQTQPNHILFTMDASTLQNFVLETFKTAAKLFESPKLLSTSSFSNTNSSSRQPREAIHQWDSSEYWQIDVLRNIIINLDFKLARVCLMKELEIRKEFSFVMSIGLSHRNARPMLVTAVGDSNLESV